MEALFTAHVHAIIAGVDVTGHHTRQGRANEEKHIRVVSARSSFFLLIRSFRVSASRRACWMRDCIASGDTSLGP
jgi:hypothetical protein